MICKIDRITDRTDHPVKPRNYLTGRTGRLVELDEGYPLVIDFGSASLVTSPVADIRQSRRPRRPRSSRCPEPLPPRESQYPALPSLRS